MDYEEDENLLCEFEKNILSHYSFASQFLNYTGTALTFFHTQYSNHPTRFLNLITINYHRNIDKYVFQFASTDLVDCEGVRETYEKILESSFFEDKLFFLREIIYVGENCTDVPIISSEELFFGQNYQALNLEENYGFLRKIDSDTLATSFLGRHDIVLLNTVPNDIFCSGQELLRLNFKHR